MGSPWRSIDRRGAIVACTALLAACVVDAGTTGHELCAPSPSYFVAEVSPRYLVPNLCGTSECHAFDGGQGVLRLRDTDADAAPAAGSPLSAWSLSWRENYLSSIQFLRCDAPLQSRLLTMPEGIGNLHPPGPVVRDRATAREVIEAWIVAP